MVKCAAPANDYGRICGTYHYDDCGRCPECGAGVYWQNFVDEEDWEKFEQLAFNQEALRLLKRAIKIADQETISKMKEIVNESNKK